MDDTTIAQQTYDNAHIAWLVCLYGVLFKARKEGLMAIELDVEESEKSSLFLRFPQVLTGPYFEFATDVLRMMVSGNLNAHEMGSYADNRIATLTASRWETRRWRKPDASLLRTIWLALWASISGYNPMQAVEFGRQGVPFKLKPGFLELENLCRVDRGVALDAFMASPDAPPETPAPEPIRADDAHPAQDDEDTFVFDDILKLDDKAIQVMLREMTQDMLIIALKAARPALVKKFLRNMSKRAAETMYEDLVTSLPMQLVVVETQQKEILKIARRLADEGEISLRFGDEETV